MKTLLNRINIVVRLLLTRIHIQIIRLRLTITTTLFRIRKNSVAFYWRRILYPHYWGIAKTISHWIDDGKVLSYDFESEAIRKAYREMSEC